MSTSSWPAYVSIGRRLLYGGDARLIILVVVIAAIIVWVLIQRKR